MITSTTSVTNKKKAGIVGGITGLFVVSMLAMFGISGETVIELNYNIYATTPTVQLTMEAPDDFNIDVVELYLNGTYVTRSLFPNATLVTIPFVLSNLDNVHLQFYCRGDVVGIGKFKDDKLYIAVKDSNAGSATKVSDSNVVDIDIEKVEE